MMLSMIRMPRREFAEHEDRHPADEDDDDDEHQKLLNSHCTYYGKNRMAILTSVIKTPTAIVHVHQHVLTAVSCLLVSSLNVSTHSREPRAASPAPPAAAPGSVLDYCRIHGIAPLSPARVSTARRLLREHAGLFFHRGFVGMVQDDEATLIFSGLNLEGAFGVDTFTL